MKYLNIRPRQRYDLEMILTNAFSPLEGFLTQADYEKVLTHSRLANHSLWPIPITLDVNDEFAEKISVGNEINLCDADNTVLAKMKITDKWKPNKSFEAQKVFGTQDFKHPAVDYLFNGAGSWYLGGPVQTVKLPAHFDFSELRFTPNLLKQHFKTRGWEKIIGFQTRNPIHRAHMELTLRAAKEANGQILIHPVVGLTKPGDIDYHTRVRCYQKILQHYPNQKAMLSLLPLAMRMAGPREAVWHAIIRKNYGCTHFIVGRDHAGPGNNSQNKPFYDPYEAQKLAIGYEDEMGIKILPFQEMVYVKESESYFPVNELKPNQTALAISGTELRENLLTNKPIPNWFSFPEVIQELRDSCPPKHKRGFTLFFTGLSGAGKSTIAQALMSKLMSQDKRSITIIDGDVVRQILGDKLGFSQTDRAINVRLMSYVASEVTKAGGIALCAAIAPYLSMRTSSRQLIVQKGEFIEVYVSTSLNICEKRDVKGLYSKARAGTLKGLTGIDDPYEPPENSEIMIDTAFLSVEESVKKIMNYLHEKNFVC